MSPARWRSSTSPHRVAGSRAGAGLGYRGRRARSPVHTAAAGPVRRYARAGRSSRSPRPDRLTACELDVLRTLARGLSNAEMGRELGIRETTVNTRVAHILDKYQLRHRVTGRGARLRLDGRGCGARCHEAAPGRRPGCQSGRCPCVSHSLTRTRYSLMARVS
ncbi:response regulator transcription factor [Streptomyces sp. NPDC102405]|uniref:helix-turn-helix transcriptional regulator n=1 Tax=Streptomyces sp. NPDC102405 TaxID=3366170 RepID=UPI003800F856